MAKDESKPNAERQMAVLGCTMSVFTTTPALVPRQNLSMLWAGTYTTSRQTGPTPT